MPGAVEWVVREVRRLDHVPQYIDAETVHAAVKPEANDLVHGGPYVLVAPVEVGLLLQEGVVVILAGGHVPFPGRTAEIADPIIWWTAIPAGIAPDVPVAFWIAARRATLNEPGVLNGC